MPIVTVRYTLPEEQVEYEMSTKTGAYASTLHDIIMRLRNKVKYGVSEEEANKKLSAPEFYEKEYEEVLNILDDNRLSFEDIV